MKKIKKQTGKQMLEKALKPQFRQTYLQKPSYMTLGKSINGNTASFSTSLVRHNKTHKKLHKKADNDFMANATEKLAYKKHKKSKRQMTQAEDTAADKKAGRKEGSPADIKQDRRDNIHDKKMCKTHKKNHCKKCM